MGKADDSGAFRIATGIIQWDICLVLILDPYKVKWTHRLAGSTESRNNTEKERERERVYIILLYIIVYICILYHKHTHTHTRKHTHTHIIHIYIYVYVYIYIYRVYYVIISEDRLSGRRSISLSAFPWASCSIVTFICHSNLQHVETTSQVCCQPQTQHPAESSLSEVGPTGQGIRRAGLLITQLWAAVRGIELTHSPRWIAHDVKQAANFGHPPGCWGWLVAGPKNKV